MKAFFEKDADLSLVRGRRVAIFGYGNQGRPQALNLRDSGVETVLVAARPGSASGARAVQDGFDVLTPADAARACDLFVMLVPDEEQPAPYADAIGPNLPQGAALVFAHGFAIRFGLIAPRPDLDVILVAPKGPGTALRSAYEAGGGLVSLYAVHQDATGGGEALALSYAAALGSGRAGILATSFAEECEADLFNEQAVIWGAIPELILAGYETLTENGFSPEVAYFECLTELKLLADLIQARGIAGMREAISTTAEFGAVVGGSRIVGEGTRAEMRRILTEVQQGAFADALMKDAAAGYPRLNASRQQAAAHPIEGVGRRLRALKP